MNASNTGPTTTLNAIREHSPCRDGWMRLLRTLGKSNADDEPLSIDIAARLAAEAAQEARLREVCRYIFEQRA